MIRYHWQLERIIGKLVKMGNNPGTFLLDKTAKPSSAKPTPPLPRSLTL